MQKVFNIDNSSNSLHWDVLQKSLDSLITVLGKYNITSKISLPEFSYQDKLEQLPVNSTPLEIDQNISNLNERRKSLHGMVKRDGWKWEDVVNENS